MVCPKGPSKYAHVSKLVTDSASFASEFPTGRKLGKINKQIKAAACGWSSVLLLNKRVLFNVKPLMTYLNGESLLPEAS